MTDNQYNAIQEALAATGESIIVIDSLENADTDGLLDEAKTLDMNYIFVLDDMVMYKASAEITSNLTDQQQYNNLYDVCGDEIPSVLMNRNVISYCNKLVKD